MAPFNSWINTQLICNVYLLGCLNVCIKVAEVVCMQSGLLDGLHRQAGAYGSFLMQEHEHWIGSSAAGGETSSSLTPLRFSSTMMFQTRTSGCMLLKSVKPYNLCFDQS